MNDVILLNMVQCCHCKQLIVSKDRHDFVSCECSKVSVDGGRVYLRRVYPKTPDDYIEKSVVVRDGKIIQFTK